MKEVAYVVEDCVAMTQCGRGHSHLTCRTGTFICDNKDPPNKEVNPLSSRSSTLTLRPCLTFKKSSFNFKTSTGMKLSSLVGLCVLVWTSLASPDCEWDKEEDQGLAVNPAIMLDKILEVSGPEACQAACCAQQDCDLALVTVLQDKSHCMLVNCFIQGHDVCELEPNTEFTAYRKKRAEKSDDSGSVLRVVPLMMAPKTETNTTSNQSQDAASPVKSEPAVDMSTPSQQKDMSAAEFAEHCEAEPEVGPCRAAFQVWYYNSETGSCQTFIYGGCRGNKNNYVTKESCMATCSAVRVLPSIQKVATDEVSQEYRDNCLVSSDPGPCRAAFPMFYYNPNTASCQTFIYGGCRGNKNRYNTKEQCMIRCTQDGAFDTRGKAHDRWTAGVFLFITLAVISALLLVTLVVITVRRHNLSRRPSSISDKEELLPDLDEQSSLESLPVPESPKPDEA